MIGWARRMFQRRAAYHTNPSETARAVEELRKAKAVLQRSTIEAAEGERLASSLNQLRSQNHFAAGMRRQIWESQR